MQRLPSEFFKLPSNNESIISSPVCDAARKYDIYTKTTQILEREWSKRTYRRFSLNSK